MAEKIALIALGGGLPRKLIKKLEAKDDQFIVVVIDELSGDNVNHIRRARRFSIFDIGKLKQYIISEKVTQISYAGEIQYAKVRDGQIDAMNMSFDEVLRKVVDSPEVLPVMLKNIFGKLVKKVLPAENLLDAVRAPRKVITKKKLSLDDQADRLVALSIFGSLQRYNCGHAVIVKRGRVLGICADEGTDSLLERCASLSGQDRGGVLVKIPRPEIATSIGMPVVGLTTIEGIRKTNLNGLVISAGSTLVFDYDKVVELANEHELFIEGIDPEVHLERMRAH